MEDRILKISGLLIVFIMKFMFDSFEKSVIPHYKLKIGPQITRK